MADTIHRTDNSAVDSSAIIPTGLADKKVAGNNIDLDENEKENRESKQPVISFARNVSREPHNFIPRGRQGFTIFCDDDDEVARDCTQFTTSREPLVVVRTDFLSFTCENGGNSDPVVSEGSEETTITKMSTGSQLDESNSNEDEGESDSVFESLADDPSEYVTAPNVSEKEIHEDRALCHPDYWCDIYTYMRFREQHLRPKWSYMKKQTEITPEMRFIVVDWLADVAVEYDFSIETLHLAVSLVDRTLSVVDCPRLKLQLLGTTAAMIASKFEEIYPPELKEFVYITDDTYTTSQILRMEKVVLSCLRFQVSAPTSNWFAGRLARKTRSPKKTVFTMNYLLELALLDYVYVAYRPSVLASAALCFANILTGLAPWSAEVEAESGVSIGEMFEVLTLLLRSFTMASKSDHKAVYDKYSAAKFESVACLPPPISLPSVYQ